MTRRAALLEATMKRKIIQLVPAVSMGFWRSAAGVIALCDDGTVWGLDLGKKDAEWERAPLIPQDAMS